MLALEKNYSLVGIRLTYISQVEEDDETDIRQKKMIKNFLFSFDELNNAIWIELEKFNDRPFQKREGSCDGR